MPRSRGFGSTLKRGPRRKTAWIFGTQTGVDGAPQAVTGSVSTLATGALEFTAPATLVRIRGMLSLFLESSAAAANGFHGAFGIGLASTPAITAGIASLPIPITDEEDSNWMFHQYFAIHSGGTIAAATAAQQADQVNSTFAALQI